MTPTQTETGLARRAICTWMLLALTACTGSAGCRAGRPASGRRVDEAWAAAERSLPPERETAPAPAQTVDPPADDAIATVNGRPIPRYRIVDLLLAGHGPGVLEQLVVLEAAKTLAAERGLVVTEADVEAEYTRSLKQLTSALPGGEPDIFDRKAGETILADILSRRNISAREYRLAVERNAHLRKIVTDRLRFTEQQLREEFDGVYSQGAQVRHIQLADLSQAQEVRRRLDAGADFAELARQFSTNADTARNGGRLPLLTPDDPDIPAVLREVAFALNDGDVSNPVRVEGEYHILFRERTVSRRPVDFAAVRDELEQRLRDRATTPAMQQLYRTLYEQADITIYDPVLRSAVERKRGQQPPAGQGPE
ncbi:MAG: peptidylprolyl isomerase [Phycisphaerales bacterium]|nr:MAG: peptidylprolyl isomerase [Phycisphaerales bacterium]